MKKFSPAEVRSALETARSETEQFLCDLIRRPSLSGSEMDAVEYARQRFAEITEVEPVLLSNALRNDPDFSDPVPGIEYDGRSNLRVRLPGSGGGRKLLLNTHIDVVPPPLGRDDMFTPSAEAGLVKGRGACDAKGQIAAIFAAFSALKRLGVPLRGDLVAHLVVEEEVGGNGTLAMIRRGEKADACIVMEPTELRILSSVRGAVWFRVTCSGRPGHSGRALETVSALKMAVRVIEILEQYHASLLASSRGIALFDSFQNPMPITFGKLIAGDWPAAAPAKAVIEGVLGLLPNKTRTQVMDEMRQAIIQNGDQWLREHFKLDFMYRHDANVLDTKHPLVTGLQSCCKEMGLAGEISAMTASCDSWFYNNQLGIPTVVFGAGSLGYAHTDHEQIRTDEILQAASVLVQFAQQWCGGEN